MISVRVWNLQSDRDAEAVRFLENTFLRFRQLEYLAIRTAGRSALRKCHRQGVPVSSNLRKTLQYYLVQDDYIILIIDTDQQDLQESSALVYHLRQIVKDYDFSDKVFFTGYSRIWCPISTQWQSIISRFRTEVESERKWFREEWDRTVAHFHKPLLTHQKKK